MKSQNIILTGFMGSGKSTIGPILAKISGYKYLETDNIIEKKENTAIKDIFQKQGEAYFRKLEYEICQEMRSWKNCIISTGGGMIIQKSNQAHLKKAGWIFLLQISLENTFQRVPKNDTRPLFQNPDDVKKLWGKREPIYEKNADFIINTDHKTPLNIAHDIWKLYQKHK